MFLMAENFKHVFIGWKFSRRIEIRGCFYLKTYFQDTFHTSCLNLVKIYEVSIPAFHEKLRFYISLVFACNKQTHVQKLTYKQGETKKRNTNKNNLNEFQLKQSDDQKQISAGEVRGKRVWFIWISAIKNWGIISFVRTRILHKCVSIR